MRKIFISLLIGSFFSHSLIAQTNKFQITGNLFNLKQGLIQSSLIEIEKAHEQTNYLINTATSSDQKERLRYVNDRLSRAEVLLRQTLSQQPNNPSYPPSLPEPPQQFTQIELYKSDSCSGSLIGLINEETNCQTYSDTTVWGIKINGQCFNTLDMSGSQACENFKDAGNPNTLKIYKSDRCSDNLSAIITQTTNCDTLDNENRTAWGINIAGKCMDPSDMSPRMACNSFRGSLSNPNVEIYKSDRCTDSLTAIIDRYTDCSTLKNLPSAWAIKINGVCQDISDADIVTACNRFKP